MSTRMRATAAPAPGNVTDAGLRRICFGVPAVILAGAWLWLALDRGTPWLWNVPVHESGRYTLGQTIFYFGHFLREVPTDIVYALFVLAGARVGARPRRGRTPPIAVAALLAAAALIAVALFRAAATQGWDWALRDLFQMRTRDDLVAYGSHWRFHWLSTLWFGVTAMLAVPLLAPSSTVFAESGRRLAPAAWLAWGTFLALTLVFGISADIFADVRYTGHQAREIMTHGPITGLLAAGVLQAMADRTTVPGREVRPFERIRGQGIAVALFLIIPLYLAAVTLAGDPMQAGQAEQGLAAMVAGHIFEHTLDYLLVTLLVAGGYAAWVGRPTAGSGADTRQDGK